MQGMISPTFGNGYEHSIDSSKNGFLYSHVAHAMDQVYFVLDKFFTFMFWLQLTS
jgi:hypothetical protein